MIWDIFEGSRSDVTFHTYRELARRTYSFAALAAMEPWRPTRTGPAEPERLEGQSVSANYFRVGISPVLERDFEAADDAFHGPKVVILSNGLWQRRFGGDRGVIGRGIALDGDGYEVVGVMPRGFENVLASSAEIWSPMQYDAGHITDLDTAEWGHHLRMCGRLRPGVSKENAAQELRTIAGTPVAEFPRAPWAALKYGFIVESLRDAVTRNGLSLGARRFAYKHSEPGDPAGHAFRRAWFGHRAGRSCSGEPSHGRVAVRRVAA
jgi:putative ABC transport system permease protein